VGGGLVFIFLHRKRIGKCTKRRWKNSRVEWSILGSLVLKKSISLPPWRRVWVEGISKVDTKVRGERRDRGKGMRKDLL